VGLAGPRRPEQHDVGGLREEVELVKVGDLLAAHRALEGEVKVVQVFTWAKWAALTRAAPPWVSREATSSDKTWARYCS